MAVHMQTNVLGGCKLKQPIAKLDTGCTCRLRAAIEALKTGQIVAHQTGLSLIPVDVISQL